MHSRTHTLTANVIESQEPSIKGSGAVNENLSAHFSRSTERRSRIIVPSISFLTVLCVIVGGYFRVANVDRALYCVDEMKTSLTLAGAKIFDFSHKCYEHDVKPDQLRSLINMQTADWKSTSTALWENEPFNPPLYFLMAHWWAERNGNLLKNIRSLSAYISLLEIPCMYVLALELFACPITAMLSAALIATSPFHLLAAQEARPYSLWTVMTILSLIFLARSMKQKTIPNLVGFGLSALGLAFTHLSSLRIFLAMITSAMLQDRFRLKSSTMVLVSIASIAVLAEAAWIVNMQSYLPLDSQGITWFQNHAGIGSSIKSWFGFLTGLVWVSNDNDTFSPIVSISTFLIEVAAAIALCRTAPKNSKILIGSTFIVCALSMLLPDLLFGGNQSKNLRYMVPIALCIQLSAAYWLARWNLSDRSFRKTAFTLITLIALLGTQIVSCRNIADSHIRSTWRPFEQFEVKATSILNGCHNPVLLGTQPNNGRIAVLMCLSQFLNPNVTINFASGATYPDVPTGHSDVFAWCPTDDALAKFSQQGYTISPAAEGLKTDQLCRLKK